MRVCVGGWERGLMQCLKKILTSSEYLHVGTYIPKNDQDRDSRDNFPGGGGGEARGGVIDLVSENMIISILDIN